MLPLKIERHCDPNLSPTHDTGRHGCCRSVALPVAYHRMRTSWARCEDCASTTDYHLAAISATRAGFTALTKATRAARRLILSGLPPLWLSGSPMRSLHRKLSPDGWSATGGRRKTATHRQPQRGPRAEREPPCPDTLSDRGLGPTRHLLAIRNAPGTHRHRARRMGSDGRDHGLCCPCAR